MQPQLKFIQRFVNYYCYYKIFIFGGAWLAEKNV